jgi:hypothetical protein
MKLQKNQKRMIIVLGIVLLYAVIDVVNNAEQYTQYYFLTENSGSTIVPPKKVKTYSVNKVQLKDKISWKRDPFTHSYQKKLKVVKKEFQSDFTLELKAITYNTDNSFIMINDLILMEGESIQGYLINKIYKDKVKLLKNGSSKFIYLNSK